MKRLVLGMLMMSSFAWADASVYLSTLNANDNNAASCSEFFDSMTGALGMKLDSSRLQNISTTEFVQAVTDRTTTKIIDTSVPVRELIVYCPGCSSTDYLKVVLSNAGGLVGSAGLGNFEPATFAAPLDHANIRWYQTTGSSVTMWIEATSPSVKVTYTLKTFPAISSTLAAW